MQDFKKLKAWQRAHELVLAVYRASSSFPGEERLGLTAQVRRSAVSVPSNIAEGCGRFGNKELGRFLGIATGSVSECEYQLLLARDLGYIDANEHSGLDSQASEVRKMLVSLIEKLGPN